MISQALENRIFTYAIIGSCLIHALFLVQMTFFQLWNARNLHRATEITYQRPAEKKQNNQIKEVKKKSVKKIKMPVNKQVALLNKGKTPVLDKIQLAKKQSSEQVAMLYGQRKISLPVFKSEKLTSPKYQTYHNIIREKIRQRAYMYVNDPEFQPGEVYLTFVLLSNGGLQQVQLIEGKTKANDYLRKVGFYSIKESAPFPAFPPDLNYPELSFHVVISFEIK